MKRLVWLFDVDGTLIRTYGAAREAFSAAISSQLGVEDDLDGIALRLSCARVWGGTRAAVFQRLWSEWRPSDASSVCRARAMWSALLPPPPVLLAAP